MPIQQNYAFTTEYDWRVNVLINEVEVFEAFEPRPDTPQPIGKKYKAIWDTGATATVITKKVAESLGLAESGVTKVRGVHSESLTSTYLINIGLPNKVMVGPLKVSEAKSLGDCDVLIGMDVISMGDFSVSNYNGKTVFSFRIPSCERTCYVHQNKKAPPGANRAERRAIKNKKKVKPKRR